MLKFCSLFSGSSGNSLLVQSENAKILVDVGVSGKKIIDALTSININISEINAIIISHEHSDHIKSLKILSNKFNIPVYANKETWNAMPLEYKKVDKENIRYFELDKQFNIKDLKILPFSIPHDAANPCGFNVFNDNSKISIATDIGNMTPQVFNSLENSSFILLESNYDPDVLKYSSYPYKLKERISGPIGHLPNYLAGETISKLIHTGLKSVMLGHLSKENNFPELAYQTVIEELSKSNLPNNCIEVNVASRYEPSKIIEIA